jgi:hypothetical protein
MTLIMHKCLPTVSPLFITIMVTYPCKFCNMGSYGKYLKGLNNWQVTYFKWDELTNTSLHRLLQPQSLAHVSCTLWVSMVSI